MGCGTGVVALNLVRDLLAAHPNSLVLFVPAEITTFCFYPGVEKNRMVASKCGLRGVGSVCVCT